MTIAAGFVCTDGLLLASDTLYSSQENRSGQTFWEVLREGDAVVIFGGAGTEPSLKRIRDELIERLAGKTTKREIVETIEEVLLYVDQKWHTEPGYETLGLVRK